MKVDVSKDFGIVVWTKFKLDDTLDTKKIIEKLERRFNSIIPLIKIDFIMVTN